MLHCTQIEDRSAAVSLLFDWRFSPFAPGSPLGRLIERAATEMAARVSYATPLPAVPAFTALTPWGRIDESGTPADTLRVYVGPSSPGTLGEGGPVSYQSGGVLSRPPGFTLAVDPNSATWLTYSLPTVTAHEVLHGVGVASHSPNPNAVLAPTLPPGPDRTLTPADVSLARRYGVEIDTADLPAVRWDGPFGLVGWVSLSVSVAADWTTAGASGGPGR